MRWDARWHAVFAGGVRETAQWLRGIARGTTSRVSSTMEVGRLEQEKDEATDWEAEHERIGRHPARASRLR